MKKKLYIEVEWFENIGIAVVYDNIFGSIIFILGIVTLEISYK